MITQILGAGKFLFFGANRIGCLFRVGEDRAEGCRLRVIGQVGCRSVEAHPARLGMSFLDVLAALAGVKLYPAGRVVGAGRSLWGCSPQCADIA